MKKQAELIAPWDWQQAALNLTQPHGITLVSAPRGSGRTSLGLFAAKICAENQGRVAFVTEMIKSWDDYENVVFDVVPKRKSVIPMRRMEFDFNGKFESGGSIELMTPNLMWRLAKERFDFVIVDDADLFTEDFGHYLEDKLEDSGALLIGYVLNSNPWFKQRWTRSGDYGYNSLAFHIVG